MTYYPNTDLIKTYGEWKFNYDRNGSLTSRGKTAAENPSVEEPFTSWIFDASDGEVWYYEYDLSGRMTKSSSSKKGTSGLTERATCAYDWRGLLVKKTYTEFTADEGVSITGGSTASVTEWYEYTQDGRLLYTEKSDGTATAKTDYIWAETTLWCEVDDVNVYWHHTDHLGTTEAVTDEAGTVVWHAKYEAFGSILNENGTESFTPSFTGKMLDECSGLYYFNARWYDSEMCRFITQDPARDGENWYGYCNGNPVTRFDKTGKYWDYIVEGNTVLKVWVEETVVTETVALSTASKFGLWGILTAFCLSLQGDTLQTPLPPGYEKDYESGIIRGPNGFVATNSDAWDEYNALLNAEKAYKKEINKARKKAVRKAWKQEKALVESGQRGTRNWTKAEKAELLKKGKVKGYQGHHINNVKDHPELAGNPDNIEFLTPEEHLDKHDGNYKNETHGELLDRSIGK